MWGAAREVELEAGQEAGLEAGLKAEWEVGREES